MPRGTAAASARRPLAKQVDLKLPSRTAGESRSVPAYPAV